MNNQIRVLHVLSRLNPGGIESWLLQLMPHLPAHVRFDFAVTSPKPGRYDSAFLDFGSTVTHVGSAYRIATSGARLARLLSKGQYQAVHSHLHHFSGAVLRVASRTGTPIRIAHSHSDRRAAESRATRIRKIYLATMKHLVNRHATRRLAVSEGSGLSLFGVGSSFEVVPCGIDLTRFSGQEVGDGPDPRLELGIGQSELVVGTVGRLEQVKNQSFLIEIFSELVCLRPDSHLVIVGDGPLKEALRTKVNVLGLGKRVHFLGTRDDVPLLMSRLFDVYVLPSTYEGLPVTVIEAQAAGLPTVISTGVTEEAVIVDSLVRRHPLEAGASAWRDLILDHQAKALIDRQAAARQVQASEFNLSNSINRLVELYNQDS